ncbi:hypothetical protein NBRC10512v2_005698 [Rhodotorula toruloides]
MSTLNAYSPPYTPAPSPQPSSSRTSTTDSSTSHARQARELLAAFAAAEADKLIETKGLDFIDREEAKRQARQHAEQAISPDNY